MSSPSRVRMTGPLTSYASGFAAGLAGQGYRPNSAAGQLQLMAHLSCWMAGEGVAAGGLTSAVIDAFLVARRAAGYTLLLSPKALEPLMSHLRDVGAAPQAPLPVLNVSEGLLARFSEYLIGERGLGRPTAEGYVRAVRPFVWGRAVDGVLELEGLTAADVTGFVVAVCPARSTGSAKMVVCALRSLLRFLHVEGLIVAPLADAVPSVAGRKLAGLPRSLDPSEIDRLLASCDRRTRAGRRNFAMMLLLVRLGLRAGEVSGLALDDIDWRAGEVVIHGKGNRVERLPLPADVGEAVAGYLRRGRPATAEGRTVFVRIRAPHRALTSTAVTNVVWAAGQRAGLGQLGAHRLRHTAATQMVRVGVPLPDIGQVLRHRRLLTTAIYAKVDRDSLRLVARPWPGTPA